MKGIPGWLIDYYRSTDKKVFGGITALTAILVTLNYRYRLNALFYAPTHFYLRFARFFLFFAFVFAASYLISFVASKRGLPRHPLFYILLALGPAIFAVKISLQVHLELFTVMADPWKKYLEIVLNWPVKAVVTFSLTALLWRCCGYGKPLPGLSSANVNARPYFVLLAGMIPLLALAGLTKDFQVAYPKAHNINFILSHSAYPWLAKALFEVCYGMDFFTIEFFFRGFLILAFVRFAGINAVLPMAAFYCTIHFGKPLLECISSYFGAIILGVVVYHTRSIWGGLIVHLGIAWLMELTGLLRI